MKFIAIASLAAVVGTAYATPQRKRSIENKYITNVDEQKSSPLAAIDPYLGLTNRKLSMSMHHGEYFVTYLHYTAKYDICVSVSCHYVHMMCLILIVIMFNLYLIIKTMTTIMT